jgi:hypothetical protein
MGYIDPEYYTSFKLNDKSEVYSFGVVLLELLSAKPALDFRRGGDETGLVNFARVHIESGDLQVFLDESLLETFNDPSGSGRESLLEFGQLALKCAEMQSKARPSMKEVLTELLRMRNSQQGNTGDSDFEGDSEYYEDSHVIPSSQILSDSDAILFMQNEGHSVEMTNFSAS